MTFGIDVEDSLEEYIDYMLLFFIPRGGSRGQMLVLM